MARRTPSGSSGATRAQGRRSLPPEPTFVDLDVSDKAERDPVLLHLLKVTDGALSEGFGFHSWVQADHIEVHPLVVTRCVDIGDVRNEGNAESEASADADTKRHTTANELLEHVHATVSSLAVEHQQRYPRKEHASANDCGLQHRTILPDQRAPSGSSALVVRPEFDPGDAFVIWMTFGRKLDRMRHDYFADSVPRVSRRPRRFFW